ncbi:hypothetical protein ACFWSF_17365 [Streptomyces sp. NPDC058611]|uniref:hypothetical protein n=1 Tax=unclassified Streptomyces TaxID=2593676 RepID=UPI00364E84AE
MTGDPTWVRGRALILQALIEECRPLKWSKWYAPPLSYALAGSSVGMLGYSFASLLIPEGAFSVTWRLVVILAIALLFFVLGWIVGKSMMRKCRVEIWLRREELPTRWWRVTAGESIMAVIALLAVVVAVIFGLVSHSDASDDDTKKPSVKSSPSA